MNPDDVARALFEARGSVGKAAQSLGVPSAELRKSVSNLHQLRAAALEAAERNLDKAEAIILKGMDSTDKLKRLEAAALVLKGRFRG
jgi:hypothetical protein